MHCESENHTWSHTWNFSQKISAKSVTNTVKDFTKTLWLRKSGTKASGPQVCCQTLAGHWRGMYLTSNTGESHTPLPFRRKFLPVSWARKVLFCTLKFLCIFETPPDRKNSVYISEFSIKRTAKFIYWSSWDKKKNSQILLTSVIDCTIKEICNVSKNCKVVPEHGMREYKGRRSTTSPFLSFGTRFRWAVKCTLQKKRTSMLIKRSNLMQQYADIYSLHSHSTCFGCHSTHHQEY